MKSASVSEVSVMNSVEPAYLPCASKCLDNPYGEQMFFTPLI